MVLVAATHRRFGKVADGTNTRVVTCMINKCRAKIDWKGIYNARNPPGKEGGKLKEEYGSNLYDLENLCNLALMKG